MAKAYPKAVPDKKRRVKLREADRDRAARFAEEIYARGSELALIVGRHLDVDAHAPVRELHLTTISSGQSSAVRVGGIDIFIDPETGDCMIYDHDAGECIPCADA